MPSRLSGIFARSSKEQEAKADEAANQNHGPSSDPVPEYSESQVSPPDYTADGDALPPDYTAGFASLSISDEPSLEIPQVNETIAHLKTLECFYRLKQTIATTDGIFGIDNAKVVDIARTFGLGNGDGADEFLPRLAEKRWAIYVSRAVDRFHAWVSTAVPATTMPTMAELEESGRSGHIVMESAHVQHQMPPIDRSNMPPVDVLMVWHAYMLNPRAYLEDCVRLGWMALWYTKMPWSAVAECINPSTFAFEAGPVAEGSFNRSTGHYWDNLLDLNSKRVQCPNCQMRLEVPWTTCCEYSVDEREPARSLADNVDAMLASGEGICDRDFAFTCYGCATRLTHNVLRAGRFCADVKLLLSHSTPMPGTIIGLRGFPFRYGMYKDTAWNGVFSKVNHLLFFGLGKKILDQPHLHGDGLNQSMARIRDTIGETISENKKYMRAVRNAASHRMTRLERIGVRKMMSRYWENSSPFAIDLVGAVIRQGGFVEKMHNIDWLHSPALPATMTRLIFKYERFVSLMEDPSHMAVPTLDVDLAWHTHQLNPPSYMKYIVNKTRQYVDHDDKVAETALNNAFAWTSKTYEKKYGDKYSECTCWYCEATRESHTSLSSRIFSSKGKEAKLHDNAESDPKRFNHISAHNAVRPTDDPKYTAEAQVQADALEAAYQKACERATKKGSTPPKRNDYYWSSAYGYPVYIPAYSPFVYVPYTPMYYPTTPGCMAVSHGAGGTCAAGTCSGAVSAGACGAGHCGGGVTGGCSGGQALGGGSGPGCSTTGGAGCSGGGGGGGGCGGGGGGGC